MSEGWQGPCQAVSEKMDKTGSFQIKHIQFLTPCTEIHVPCKGGEGKAQYGANCMKTRITLENI